MSRVSKVMMSVAMMAMVLVCLIGCLSPILMMSVQALRSGNVMRRTYAGSRTCSGTATTTTLSGDQTCMPLSQVGEGSNLTLTPGTSSLASYTYAGFQCPDTIGTTGKAPEEFSLYTTSTCGDATNVGGTVPASGCYTGVGGTDSYKFVCGSCGLTVPKFYNFNDKAPKTMKMRWFSDTACKVQIADSDNLNTTTSCVADRDGVTSFAFYCAVGVSDCTMVRWSDSNDCCWVPMGDNYIYGVDFTDGACVQRGTQSVRITSGNLSSATSTANLSLMSMLAAALALFAAKQL